MTNMPGKKSGSRPDKAAPTKPPWLHSVFAARFPLLTVTTLVEAPSSMVMMAGLGLFMNLRLRIWQKERKSDAKHLAVRHL